PAPSDHGLASPSKPIETAGGSYAAGPFLQLPAHGSGSAAIFGACVGASKSGLLCTRRPASINSLPQTSRRLYCTRVSREPADGDPRYRIRLQAIIYRLIDREVPHSTSQPRNCPARLICHSTRNPRQNPFPQLVNLGLGNATKSFIARHPRGIARRP